MRAPLRAVLLCLAVGWAPSRTDAVSGPWFETPQSKVRLISRYLAASPDGDAGLAVEFRLAPGWHVYWKNAGDAGYPPELDLESASIGTTVLRFPAPSRFDLPGGLVAFGYEGEAIYPIDATLASDARESAALTGELDYLVCAESCLPYQAKLQLLLPLATRSSGETDPRLDPATAPLVDAARARLPTPAPPGVRGSLAADDGGTETLEVTFAVAGVSAAAPDLFFDPHPLLTLGRPRLVASAAGPGFLVPVKAIDPTRPLPERLRLAWTATGFERAGRPLAWEGELDLARPSSHGRWSFLLPFAVAFSVFPLLWLILKRRSRDRARAE
jgi:DsbC/DsbD-like thiol-disulfide interchange protein